MKEQIEILRQMLYKLISSKSNLVDKEIVETSCKLDELIILYYQET